MHKTNNRRAEITAPDEIRLDFRQDFGPTHAQNGQPAVVFYSVADYEKRQKKHGEKLYPNPTNE